jgi:hypothetical protein
LGKYLTRRANQRHSFIIAQSVKRPWPRNSAVFAILGENSYPQFEVAPPRARRMIAGALPNRARFTMRVPEEIST